MFVENLEHAASRLNEKKLKIFNEVTLISLFNVFFSFLN